MVEFCVSTVEFTDADTAEANALIFDEDPPMGDVPDAEFFLAPR